MAGTRKISSAIQFSNPNEYNYLGGAQNVTLSIMTLIQFLTTRNAIFRIVTAISFCIIYIDYDKIPSYMIINIILGTFALISGSGDFFNSQDLLARLSSFIFFISVLLSLLQLFGYKFTARSPHKVSIMACLLLIVAVAVFQITWSSLNIISVSVFTLFWLLTMIGLLSIDRKGGQYMPQDQS